jgi:hypothetical protein
MKMISTSMIMEPLVDASSLNAQQIKKIVLMESSSNPGMFVVVATTDPAYVFNQSS